MIRKYQAKSNFKCFQNLDLKCAPLTLLCGLNGMGKSTVIQALLVLRQSFESGDLFDGRLVLGGELADLGTGTDVLFEDADGDTVEFEIENDEIETPWVLSFDCSHTTDQLIAATTRGLIQSPPFVAYRLGRGTCPFGHNLLYIDAERVGPQKVSIHFRIAVASASLRLSE